MRSLSALVPVACLLVLAGCSGSESSSGGADDGPDAAPSASPTTATSAPQTPEPTPTETTEPEPDPAARKELTQALKALVRSGTGSYELEFGDALSERGSYRVAPRAFELRRFLSSEAGTYTVDVRAVGPTSWMRYVDSPGELRPWPCWVDTADFAEGADPAAAQLLTSELATTQPPNAVVAATYGAGLAYSGATPGRILGTLDLIAATSLAGNSQVTLGLDPASTATTRASFDVEDGRLLGYSVQLKDMVEALSAEGVELPVEEGQLIGGVIRVRFTEVGEPVDVVAPDPAEVLDLPPGTSDFADEMAACGSGG